MSGNVGFNLEKNTQLIINNLKIQNAGTAILSNNNSATTELTKQLHEYVTKVKTSPEER